MIELEQCKRTHPLLLSNMDVHYSQPKGFVGRNICYLVKYKDEYYGTIVGGSAGKFLVGRNEFFNQYFTNWKLTNIVSNIFFHIEPKEDGYPIRNFAQKIIKTFRYKVSQDWKEKYNDDVLGFETLVELPRTGELYLRDKWSEVGITKGYTCKRVGGVGTDSYTGKRVWNTKNLRPKRVLVRLKD